MGEDQGPGGLADGGQEMGGGVAEQKCSLKFFYQDVTPLKRAYLAGEKKLGQKRYRIGKNPPQVGDIRPLRTPSPITAAVRRKKEGESGPRHTLAACSVWLVVCGGALRCACGSDGSCARW